MARKTSYRHRLICAIPYSLLHFLIAYNCLKQYLDNCCNEKDITFLKDLENNLLDIKYLINCSFVWRETKEGNDFWNRRSMWYRQYLSTNKL